MKKLYFSFITLLFLIVVNAQIVNIPDANFKAKLLSATSADGFNYVGQNAEGNAMDIDSNDNGEIDTSEAALVYRLNVTNTNIANLTGIESFTNLRSIFCSDNNINTLSLSTLSNLEYLNCSQNQLATLFLSNMPNLKDLWCNNNNLTDLSIVSFPSLQNLYCNYNNNLSTLNLADLPILQELSCISCNLSELNVNSLTSLRGLTCAINQLSNLNVNNLISLRALNCGGNTLSVLNVSNLINLQSLIFSFNQIQTIDVSNLPNLSTLICRNNNISSFYLKNGYNYNLATNDNFGTYTITGNPVNYICADEDKIASLTNYFSTNNPTINSYCSFTPGGIYYVIEGQTKFDVNNNGCDASDLVYTNLRFDIFNDTAITGSFISNTAGNYSFPVQAGTHTITPQFENPTYFTASPASVTVTFPVTISPVIQNFCITPNGVHNDLEVIIIPITVARPGFDAVYKIKYKNKGNQIENATITLNYTDAILDYVSSSVAATTQTLGTLSWNVGTLAPFQNGEIMVTLKVNSPMETPAVNANDILSYTANITSPNTDEAPDDNTFELGQLVVNSFDPNDKTCLEGTTISTDKIGKYVHYKIRFENTGTFPAQNIVVKDIIDTTKFDISTIQIIDASHSCVTKITNLNKVEFIFENINLPFDNATNDGYIVFKIKTNLTLTINSTISNLANIYFDYNFPIVTNTATSTFQVLQNDTFVFDTYFSIYPNPVGDLLSINSKLNTKIYSLSIYTILGQQVQSIINPTNMIDVSSLKSGNYILRVTTEEGISSSKFVKK